MSLTSSGSLLVVVLRDKGVVSMQGVQPQQDAIKFLKLLRNSLPVVRYMKNLHEYLENESTSTTVLTVMYLTYAFTSLLSTASSM